MAALVSPNFHVISRLIIWSHSDGTIALCSLARNKISPKRPGTIGWCTAVMLTATCLGTHVTTTQIAKNRVRVSHSWREGAVRAVSPLYEKLVETSIRSWSGQKDISQQLQSRTGKIQFTFGYLVPLAVWASAARRLPILKPARTLS